VWRNYYQNWGGLSGYPVAGAVNSDFTGRAHHVSITSVRPMRSEFTTYFNASLK